MYNMIKADIYKLSKMNSVKICILISALSACAVAYILHGVYQGTFSLDASNAFALVSDTMIVIILGAVLIATLICGDFESKNIHDEIACGNGRFAIVITKTITISLLVIMLVSPYILMTVIGFASQLGFGIYVGVPSAYFNILSNVTGVAISNEAVLKSVILCLLIALSYIAKISICIPLAFKARKPIIVIMAGFVSTFFFDIISALVKNIQGISKLIKFLPYQMIFDLTLDCSIAVMFKSIVSSLLFLLAMIGITYAMFRKAEIK